ncbi:prepilin-type N-terminal cleavage/methylation domain-containing protein [Brevundimonas sp. AJA228-03]|uniref:GspH/FimT family pseudopilin n=1 Tax=Brevundimonas sp. AJA228-03 TaxID=2752515 RepID=UPI001ADECB13|nr:GspH/FimT family pseudopilin [Brevundimonas sp. AJA228-03]QTN20490.1 prepilin-type N-terminal cleavage/methylation domain-containing protein [Brevundimonas sp. AJA228-03]
MVRVGGHIDGLCKARRSGMTLVEILVVLAIVGVMAGVVTLGVGLGDRGLGVESEANRLADRLRLAADEVLTTRRPLELAFDAEGYGFVRGDGQADRVVDALAERHRLPEGVRMTGLGVSSPVTIDPDGAQPVAAFGLARGDQRWRVEFDGLNAVARPVADAAA